MDQRIGNHTRAHREATRSRTQHARPILVRVDASSPGCAPQRHYGSAPMKDMKSRVVTFSLAILVSLAVWGGVILVAMHFVKK